MRDITMKENAAKSKQEDKCPYWALEHNRECCISKGGMYIPMPEHIQMFCHSAKYYQCQTYIRGRELILAQDDFELSEFLGSRDRRRLRRYPEQVYLDLVACDRNLNPQLMKAYKAKSLDMSLGGIRVESFMEFPPEAVVSFVLDPEFSSETLLGVGEVKWCVPKKDSNKFESGIAFSNYSTSESMREYLEI